MTSPLDPFNPLNPFSMKWDEPKNEEPIRMRPLFPLSYSSVINETDRYLCRRIENLLVENDNLKTLCLRNIDAIERLQNYVAELEKKVKEMSKWEMDIYKRFDPIYSWFITHDLHSVQEIENATMDTIELERKADLERKLKRKEENASQNQARTSGVVSNCNRKG
jgi:hypothetical protein